ncbi:MAG: Na/Pi symporter, partial [Cyanobacteria bacterium P01_G01_bin.38]
MSQVADQTQTRKKNQKNSALQWLGVVFLVYLLIVAVGMIGAGFKSATGERAEELFAFATNPFMGLIVGTVATALIQSSSTVTSIIVGLVAGGLPVATAIPMVMGANIGTTITNTLVSLGHVTDKTEFRKAFAAATVHDFFNLLSVIIFLPLEILFHPLERMGLFLANALVGGGSMSMKNLNVVKTVTSPVVDLFEGVTHILPAPFDGIL